MSDTIKIDYQAVYSKTRELRARLNGELRNMDSEYRQIQSGLRQQDSKTNATLMEVMGENQKKAQMCAEAMQHLIAFIENTTREVENQEREMRRTFDSFRQLRFTRKSRARQLRAAAPPQGGDN